MSDNKEAGIKIPAVAHLKFIQTKTEHEKKM